ncbi:hypothetical protein B0H17DRAFT_1151019 [Mycena rosella]|uniref:Uncharacterized protein n=1 Tax=Mycena rosella TaxID=1033263 RepID=A0AAD7BP00_MYCRO|nr:hypothetical protein B0H17DRAFT_1151019 [Mycena rosella]
MYDHSKIAGFRQASDAKTQEDRGKMKRPKEVWPKMQELLRKRIALKDTLERDKTPKISIGGSFLHNHSTKLLRSSTIGKPLLGLGCPRFFQETSAIICAALPNAFQTRRRASAM